MWEIERTDEVAVWIMNLDENSRQAVLKSLLILREIGPNLGRPYVDSIKQSRYQNMKELRIQNKLKVYRILFIFDPKRKAVLLIGGDKRGKKDFYDIMIPAAEKLYDKYLKGRYQNENKK
ncbi:MAG TPA: type II toxin-antitoxin system RelE/ParE family toxin [Spirochaetota bacterium]|jgi:hypothetical protein|nr:type II toxin-antitoxin system RelE/ParE family toxin [Spirochaetota bacterium]HOH38029.1 type II toxin-antitoxin system RelE/ParE family toxin [Spirochaetota bacterium]HPJ15075.1 type II toxin-antitoxin system RelE/ParE family toxin [Spirochaetota bacterium]HPM33995.1 type II toxin-antitoxin system RelE/ParE family toxin [Spirochaetota bacterium]HPW52049.1 type II toxin-antitoxin system RelE/ParE family toxin [Spirochaetota bacterium]